MLYSELFIDQFVVYINKINFLFSHIRDLCCGQVVQEYERAVIFRLGRLKQGGAKVGSGSKPSTDSSDISDFSQGPGIFFVIPCIDHFRCVDLRTVSFDVPPQEVSRKSPH